MSSASQIAVLIRPSLYRELFDDENDGRLRQLGEVTFYSGERNPSSVEVAPLTRRRRSMRTVTLLCPLRRA